jgi:hypothetical protein
MTKMNKGKISCPAFSKHSEEEIEVTKKVIKRKYDIIIPKSDLVKLTKLIKELRWWLKIDKPTMEKSITEKMVLDLKDLIKKNHGKDISMVEAKNILTIRPLQEQERVSREMRAIVIGHRRIPRDLVVLKKIIKLIRLHYGVTLDKNQIEQLVQYLTKKIWYEEGLDVSMEKCLDDLILYADKRKKGKQANDLELHDKIRQAIDEAVKKLNPAEKDFDPLYLEQC